ncbi:MAG TPA: cysteine rich repeat-containing protein [Myxococcales bacterium]|nr:cysteine rich repeat-containing protein [Myxococcales bacterium]
MPRLPIGLLVLVALPVLAADHPCRADAEKFCQGAQPGLSDACRKEGEQMARRREGHQALLRDVQQACKDDLQKFCVGVKPGGGRLARCLRSHQNELSSACTDTIEEAKDRW